MDLTTLKYIVTIAEEKRLSTASQRLFITSSALSQCIKKLESDLGVALFEKADSRTFLLTMTGRIYVEAAKKILAVEEATRREIQDVCEAKRGRFTFGCSPKRGLAAFSNVFPRFHKAYPGIRVDLVEASLNELYGLLMEGAVDIAIVTPPESQLEAVRSELLDSEEILLAVPLGHPMAKLADAPGWGSIPVQQLSMLKDDSWILANKGSMHRNLTDEIFKEAGFFPGNVLLETSSTNPHLIAIEEGIAVGFVPAPRNGIDLKMALFHLEPRRYRNLYAVYRRSYCLAESEIFLIDSLKDFYATASSAGMSPHRLGW